MKRLRQIVVICLVFWTVVVNAQNYEFNLGIYANTFRMEGLKAFQDAPYYPFPIFNKSESFPSFLAVNFSYRKKKQNYTLGAWMMYQLTGAQSYISDSTGIYTINYYLNGYSGGILIGKSFLNDKLFISANLGVQYNHLRIEEIVEVFNQKGSAEEIYYSINFPMLINVEYFLNTNNPQISVVIQFDYSSVGNELKSSSRTLPTKVDWTGIKAGINIGLAKSE